MLEPWHPSLSFVDRWGGLLKLGWWLRYPRFRAQSKTSTISHRQGCSRRTDLVCLLVKTVTSTNTHHHAKLQQCDISERLRHGCSYASTKPTPSPFLSCNNLHLQSAVAAYVVRMGSAQLFYHAWIRVAVPVDRQS